MTMDKPFMHAECGHKTKAACHILTSLDFGGVETHMEILAGLTQESELTLLFCAIGRGGFVADRLSKSGASVICLNKPVSIPSSAAILSLYMLFRRIRPQVVHTHGTEANFHGLIAAWLAGVPVRIGEEIGIPRHSSRAKQVFRQVYRLAHRVIGISDAVRNWLVESSEVPNNKAIRIYNPVRLPQEKALSQHSKDIFRIGFVGRLEAVKNPLALVEAVSLLVWKGIPAELWLVGDGSQRAAIEEQIEMSGLGDRVRLLGYQATPAQYISQCDIYVQPSLSEGFGLALVEAMGCGVPVIATAVGGAPELIKHGETGWLVDQASPAMLAGALIEGWKQGERLKSVGMAARDAVQGRFEPRRYIAELDALYCNVSSGTRYR